MLPRKICFTGLQILFTIHIAHSFVLLTANMEDLKKLARKFVSDQFAEKIVELIAKATSNLLTPAPNVSEENEANVEDIQKVSDNEVMAEPYKGRQGPKLAMRTTPSRFSDISREVVRPKRVKVNSQYAESDLRSQELTELSEYRNPLQRPIIKPKDYTSERNEQKSNNILRQSPQPQYLVSPKLDKDKETIILSNTEQKKPKISYHKSKIPDKNKNFGAQYASVNIGGKNKEKINTPTTDDRYYPITEQTVKERNPKILDLKYQDKKDKNKQQDDRYYPSSVETEKEHKQKTYLDSKYNGNKDINKEIDERYYPTIEKEEKDSEPKITDYKYQDKNDRKKEKRKVKERQNKNKELIGKDKDKSKIQIKDIDREYKSEEYLGEVRKLAEEEEENKHKKRTVKVDETFEAKPKPTKDLQTLNFDFKTNNDASKNETLHMFVQKGDELQEVTTIQQKEAAEDKMKKTGTSIEVIFG